MFPKIVMKHICFNANDGKDLMPPWIISLANKLPTIEWEWVYPKKTVGVSRQFSYVSFFATMFNLPGPEKHELKTLSKLKCFGYLIYGITTLGVLPLRASLPPPKQPQFPAKLLDLLACQPGPLNKRTTVNLRCLTPLYPIPERGFRRFHNLRCWPQFIQPKKWAPRTYCWWFRNPAFTSWGW